MHAVTDHVSNVREKIEINQNQFFYFCKIKINFIIDNFNIFDNIYVSFCFANAMNWYKLYVHE